jgi:hypothetical protein
MTAFGVLIGVIVIAVGIWAWTWNPRPGSGLSAFPAAHAPGYSKALAVCLMLLGAAWLVALALAFR